MTSETEAKLDRYRIFLASDPANSTLLADVVALSVKLGRFSEAERAVEAALSLAPTSREIVFQSGILSLAQNRHHEAATVFENLLEAGSDHPAIRYNAAYALLSAGEPGRALHHVQLLSVNQGRESVPEAGKLEARCLYHLGEFETAINILKQYAQAQPNDVEVLGLLAIVAADDAQTSLAKTSAALALAIDPANDNALQALGDMALEEHESAVAIENYQAILDRNPDSGRAWSGLAFAQSIEMRLDTAEQSFRKAVHFMPTHIGTWQGLAWLQILNGDLKGAEESLASAMSLNRNVAETHGTLGVLQILTDRQQEADLSIRRALGFNPDSPSGLYAKSLSDEKRQQPKMSMDELMERVSRSMGLTGANSIQSSVRDTVRKFSSVGNRNNES